MKRYKAVVFDLYGTLADIHTDEQRLSLWREMAAFSAGQSAARAPAVLRRRYEEITEREFKAAERTAGPRAYPEIDLLPVFRELLGLGADEEAVRAAAWRFRTLSVTHLRAYAGAGELLRALREDGRRVILLTNAQRCFTVPELNKLGLWEAFDGVYISSDYGRKKPDGDFFRAMLRDQDLEAADCLMVGNDPVCDIQGAAAVGMDTWYIRSGLSPADAPPAGDAPATYRQEGMDLKKLRKALMND